MMLWVIWGHWGLYNIVGVVPGGDAYMQNAKIGVNMPVFFMISGYFAASTFANGGWRRIVARAVGFLWPQTALAVCVAVAAKNMSAYFKDLLGR